MATTTEAGPTPDDLRYMGIALSLARRELGNVAPNPAVGCVLVRDQVILGRGWTRRGGRPHAETEALRRAAAAPGKIKGATAYVTLEPCAHHGETPPCVEALIGAGIARVVVALGDPDPRVAGRGLGRLREAGITVVEGVGADAAAAINEGYLLSRLKGRPLVAVKLATTLDGRIATLAGESQWITGEIARETGHALRATHDAIVVGAATAAADNPRLTCRLPGLESHSPLRIVFDPRLQLPLTSHLVKTASAASPTWLVTVEGLAGARREAYEDCGVTVIEVEADETGGPAIGAALKIFAQRGLTRLLVEGGGRLVAAFLAAGVVDRLYWFRAAGILGGDGVPAVGAFGVETLAAMPGFQRLDWRPLGADMLETYIRRA